jgi:hypothetical protein
MRSRWRAWFAVLVAGVAVLVTGACTAETSAGATPTSRTSDPVGRISDPDLIDFTGLRDLRIGASQADLLAAGIVTKVETACRAVEYPARRQVSPVFDGDELVLIWADPPLRTPENVTVGTPLDAARNAYPQAAELTPPAGSTTYPGLLVRGPEGAAYLLLHDGEKVQKLIVGTERHLRLLFDTGFGTC